MSRITSVTDPETGKPGKQIEFVEVRPRHPPTFAGMGEDEARLIRSIVNQFQAMGIFNIPKEVVVPKMTIILSENEYDMLGMRFEVNDTFELILKDSTISLKKVGEELA